MDDSIRQLPFDQLRTLHREIGALIAERRLEALENLRQQASILGFSADDLAPKKNGRPHLAPKFRDPATGETWSGKGRRPPWLVEALSGGRQLEEFQVT